MSALMGVDCLLLRSEIFLLLRKLHNMGLCIGCFENYFMRHQVSFRAIGNVDRFVLEGSWSAQVLAVSSTLPLWAASSVFVAFAVLFRSDLHVCHSGRHPPEVGPFGSLDLKVFSTVNRISSTHPHSRM